MERNAATGPLPSEHAIADPAAVLTSPEDVLKDSRISPANKFEILQGCAHDADRLAAEEAEGMTCGEPSLQDSVLQALNEMRRQTTSETRPRENSLPRANPTVWD